MSKTPQQKLKALQQKSKSLKLLSSTYLTRNQKSPHKKMTK